MTWRLIRHDVSEDLLMGPTLATYLGKEGEGLGEHDRKDHDHGKIQLVQLYEDFERLPVNVPTPTSETSGGGTGREAFAVLARRFKDLVAELTEHMKVESEMQIPWLESILGGKESEALARR